MKQITSAEFKTAIELDPAWASKLTEPVEITGYCDMTRTPISHLSPLLHFTGHNDEGKCADFWRCENLKIVEGTFNGFVELGKSGIEWVKNPLITRPNDTGHAINLFGCENLKTVEGIFPGFINFAESNVEQTKNVVVNHPNNSGKAASFFNCKNLKIAEGNFVGDVDFTQSGIQRIGNLTIATVANFTQCTQLLLSKDWFKKSDIIMDKDLLERSKIQLEYEAAARKAIKQPSFEL